MKHLIASVFAALALGAVAAPEFRGIIEGYYGRAYDNEGRKSLYELMKSVDMNTYVYGPKDDPYHHKKWRELYPEKEAADLKATAEEAAKNGIRFFWAIHLGDGFDGSEGDWQQLFAKLESVYALGIRSFGAFFDDFGANDPHSHATIVNRIMKEFVDKKGDINGFVMCPVYYHTTGDEDYTKTIGKELDPRVMVFWTGYDIMSNIGQTEIDIYASHLGRKPFIWWNWPVNDYCRAQLPLGRAYGITSADCVGFALNPMELCEASKTAVLQVADMIRDPAAYDPGQSLTNAYTRLYGELAPDLLTFAEYNSETYPNEHKFRRIEAPAFVELIERERFGSRMRQELDRLGAACERLEKALPEKQPKLWHEIGGWVRTLRADVRIANALLDLREARSDRRKAVQDASREWHVRPRPANGSVGQLIRFLEDDILR